MDKAREPRELDILLPDAAFRVVLTERGVSRLEFRPAAGEAPLPADGLGARVAAELAEYLAGLRRRFTVPVDLTGCSAFQVSVLEVCAEVPPGQVISYAELARRTGRPKAARAVGAALARNPVPVLVPCHRVVRADGEPGGYVAGIEWKRRLLRLEGGSFR